MNGNVFFVTLAIGAVQAVEKSIIVALHCLQLSKSFGGRPMEVYLGEEGTTAEELLHNKQGGKVRLRNTFKATVEEVKASRQYGTRIFFVNSKT